MAAHNIDHFYPTFEELCSHSKSVQVADDGDITINYDTSQRQFMPPMWSKMVYRGEIYTAQIVNQHHGYVTFRPGSFAPGELTGKGQPTLGSVKIIKRSMSRGA